MGRRGARARPHAYSPGSSTCARRSPLYRALRGAPQHAGEALLATLRGTAPQPRSGALTGRLVRVLTELDLVAVDREPLAVAVPAPAGRTALERSPAFRAYERRLEDGLAYLEAAPAATPLAGVA